MSKSNESKAANTSKPEQSAAKLALKGFKRTAFRKAMTAVGGAHDTETASREERGRAAFGIVELAREFALANSDATSETLAKGWSEYAAIEQPALAKSGNRYVEVKEATKDKPASFAWTGYGNNVISTARGVVEFDIDLNDACPLNEDGTLNHDADKRVVDSYREAERVVKAYRAEKRATDNPDAELLRVAKAEVDANWKALRALVFDTGDVSIVSALAAALESQHNNVAEQLAAQAETEQQAEAA